MSTNAPPDIKASLILSEITWACPSWYTFFVYLGLSSDDHTDWQDLEVRLDYNGDSYWDTEFMPIEPRFQWEPGVVVEGTWTVVVQMRDEEGDVSTLSVDRDVSQELPSIPDVGVAGPEIETEFFDSVDTVFVGEEFRVGYWENCWVREPIEIRREIRINGNLVDEGDSGCRPALSFCRGGGQSGLTLDEPGEYLVSVLLDADDRIKEQDETNNRAEKTLVVVASKPN